MCTRDRWLRSSRSQFPEATNFCIWPLHGCCRKIGSSVTVFSLLSIDEEIQPVQNFTVGSIKCLRRRHNWSLRPTHRDWSHTYILQYVQSVKNSQGYDPISCFLYRDDLLSWITLKQVDAFSESGR